MNRSLRINFVLHSIGKTGGVLVVLEYARQLRRLGHETRVYYPLIPYAADFNLLPRWERALRRAYAAWKTLLNVRRAALAAGDAGVRVAPFIANAFIRDADMIFATAWPTAYDVAALRPSKGQKMYFVQHYEIWGGEVGKVDASYRLPLKIVTIAPWLVDFLRIRFGRAVTAEIHNGVDLKFFCPPIKGRAAPITILMLHHVVGFKGIADGLEVLRRIHRQYPNVRIRMFGMHEFSNKDAFIEYHRDPSRTELLRLYQEAHVFLSPSLSEGWHLPPMEAMACACAVVATRVGCIPVLERDGNLLSAEPGDRDALFRHLEALIRSPELLEKIARKGRETILDYGWDKKALEMENILFSLTAP